MYYLLLKDTSTGFDVIMSHTMNVPHAYCIAFEDKDEQEDTYYSIIACDELAGESAQEIYNIITQEY